MRGPTRFLLRGWDIAMSERVRRCKLRSPGTWGDSVGRQFRQQARRFFRPLGEPLEDRTVLSVFYDLEVLAKTGDQTATGETINSIDPLISMNDNGRVAFVADVSGSSGTGSSVLVDDGASPSSLISFANPNSLRTFAFPQINNAGQVVVRDRISTLNDSFVRTWDSNNPGQFNIVAGTNETAGDTFDSVTLPTIANDGGVGFVGLTGGATQSFLYSNPSGTRFDD